MSFALAAAFLLAGPPRFLGPPEKKPAEGEPAPVGVGDPAPQFAGTVENAEAAGVERVELRTLAAGAKAVLITFFSSACEACRRELPVLQRLSTEQKGRGLRILALALDAEGIRLLRESRASYPVIADPDRRIARQYLGQQARFPALAIVDGSGRIASVKMGYAGDPETFLTAQVDAALR